MQPLPATACRDEPATSNKRGSSVLVEPLQSAAQLLPPDPGIADDLRDMRAADRCEGKTREQTPGRRLLMGHADMNKNRWGRSGRGAGEDQ
jgi:hypothetical protein